MILPGFVGGTIDRADAIRNDPARAAAAFADPAARLLLLDGLDPMVDGGALALAAIAADADPQAHALLGVDAHGPLFVALSDAVPGADSMMKVWAAASLLPAAALAHYGAARSLVDWHRRHRFCANAARRPSRKKPAGRAAACLAPPSISRGSIR